MASQQRLILQALQDLNESWPFGLTLLKFQPLIRPTWLRAQPIPGRSVRSKGGPAARVPDHEPRKGGAVEGRFMTTWQEYAMAFVLGYGTSWVLRELWRKHRQ